MFLQKEETDTTLLTSRIINKEIHKMQIKTTGQVLFLFLINTGHKETGKKIINKHSRKRKHKNINNNYTKPTDGQTKIYRTEERKCTNISKEIKERKHERNQNFDFYITTRTVERGAGKGFR